MTATTAATNGMVRMVATEPNTARARSYTNSLSRPTSRSGSESSPNPAATAVARRLARISTRALDQQDRHRHRPRDVQPHPGDNARGEAEQRDHAVDQREPHERPEPAEAEAQRLAPARLGAEV